MPNVIDAAVARSASRNAVALACIAAPRQADAASTGRPELTNWPSGTHIATYQECIDAKAAAIRQNRADDRHTLSYCDNGKHMISVTLAAPPKTGGFGSKKYTTNRVGMSDYTETP